MGKSSVYLNIGHYNTPKKKYWVVFQWVLQIRMAKIADFEWILPM
jgi:hypothetical protein